MPDNPHSDAQGQRPPAAEQQPRLDVTQYWINGVRQDLPRQPPRTAPAPHEERPMRVIVEGKVSEWQPTPPREADPGQQQVQHEWARRWANYDAYYAASPADTATRAARTRDMQAWKDRFAWRREHGKEWEVI